MHLIRKGAIGLAVSNETIIQKMMKELQLALEKPNNEQWLVKHIANVQVLCELILDQDETEQEMHIPEKERQMMFGDTLKGKETEGSLKQSKTSKLDEDDANGESIFDF